VAGRAEPRDIAICGVSTDEWDEYIVALAQETELPVSFPHGRPCLGTADGQRCAAVADVLLHGLSQARVRRLVFGAPDLKSGACVSLYRLPEDTRFNHRLEVTGGVREAECRELVQEFFKARR